MIHGYISMKARDSDRSSPEGQKAAITEFQASAGMFAMIKDNVVGLSCLS